MLNVCNSITAFYASSIGVSQMVIGEYTTTKSGLVLPGSGDIDDSAVMVVELTRTNGFVIPPGGAATRFGIVMPSSVEIAMYAPSEDRETRFIVVTNGEQLYDAVMSTLRWMRSGISGDAFTVMGGPLKDCQSDKPELSLSITKMATEDWMREAIGVTPEDDMPYWLNSD